MTYWQFKTSKNLVYLGFFDYICTVNNRTATRCVCANCLIMLLKGLMLT